jgi:hypothetical protein
VQAIYPEANVFEAYNVVDEWTEPDSVLQFVVGRAGSKAPVDQSPIVMWNFRETKAPDYVRQSLAPLLPKPPQITAGEVVAYKAK